MSEFDKKIQEKIESVCNFLTDLLKYFITLISNLLITNIGDDENENNNCSVGKNYENDNNDKSFSNSNFKTDNHLIEKENLELKKKNLELKKENNDFLVENNDMKQKLITKENDINKFKKKLLDINSKYDLLKEENENLKKLVIAFQNK